VQLCEEGGIQAYMDVMQHHQVNNSQHSERSSAFAFKEKQSNLTA